MLNNQEIFFNDFLGSIPNYIMDKVTPNDHNITSESVSMLKALLEIQSMEDLEEMKIMNETEPAKFTDGSWDL